MSSVVVTEPRSARCSSFSRPQEPVTGCAVRDRPAATHWSRSCAERVRLADPRETSGVIDGLDELPGWPLRALIPEATLAVRRLRASGTSGASTSLGLPSREAVRRKSTSGCCSVAASAGSTRRRGLHRSRGGRSRRLGLAIPSSWAFGVQPVNGPEAARRRRHRTRDLKSSVPKLTPPYRPTFEAPASCPARASSRRAGCWPRDLACPAALAAIAGYLRGTVT